MHQIGDVFGPMNLADIGAKSQQDLWFTYSTVNRLFKDKVVEAFHQGDMVWIHGFHLMLLPSFLRRVLQSARIGFFFHTPFPSSEIWKTIPRRDDLLRGILAADQIGFHLFEYARNFFTACRKILELYTINKKGGFLGIEYNGRTIILNVNHIGIN
jgi:trehalose 6-phosphate synthase/phosphatase